MEKSVHSFESVWATIDRLAEKQAEGERLRQEHERFLTEKLAETDRILSEKQQETDRLIKDVAKQVGGISYNNGSFAEEYFYNSFRRGEQNFFGEKFDDIEKNLKNRRNGLTDEYDIVMYNHSSIALIEVKYKAQMKNIPEVLKKADNFRILFPDYKDYKFYLGLASMSFLPEVEEACEKEGIAIIKQVGDKVIINDKHLKTF